MIWQWIFIALLSYAVLIWAAINLLKRYRRGLGYYLEANKDTPHGNQGPTTTAPPLAIICPGRNEAEHICETLYELCRQDFPSYRVIYVDDDSSDQTPQITSQARSEFAHLTIVRNSAPPPAGWVGKCWALHLGYQKLQELEKVPGETKWICFTDADIHWDKSTLRCALEHAEKNSADVVSLFPKLTFGSPIEAIVQLQMIQAMGILFPLDKAMDPKHPDTLTGGSFIMTRRALYDQIGGHENENIRGKVVDDISLGRTLKAAGGKISIAMAPQFLWCRMYNGWLDMWEGLTKNAYAGIDYSLWKLAGAFVGVLFGAVLPPIYLIIACIWVALAPAPLSWAALGLSVLSVALPALSLYRVCKMVKAKKRYALTMPLGTGIYLIFFIASAFKFYFGGGNVWKGRAYGSNG